MPCFEEVMVHFHVIIYNFPSRTDAIKEYVKYITKFAIEFKILMSQTHTRNTMLSINL
jgi:hypothetical protein